MGKVAMVIDTSAQGLVQLHEGIRRSACGYTYANRIAFKVECELGQAYTQGENGEHACGGGKDTRVQHR